MSIHLYMDVNVQAAITKGLRSRGVEVLTSQEDGTRRFKDPELLDRATELGRVLFTMDTDLLNEAKMRQQSGKPFAGIIYAQQKKVSIKQCIDDLELIAKIDEPADWVNRLGYLPL